MTAKPTAHVEAAHRERHRRANPDPALPVRLHDAGVRATARGRSPAFGGVPRGALAPRAEAALSATTRLGVPQARDYAVPF